ncbi:MAG: MFS transporter, partial [Chloroflexi bacterium]|nr:MFS transporter [Chloroflexota bacterium]
MPSDFFERLHAAVELSDRPADRLHLLGDHAHVISLASGFGLAALAIVLNLVGGLAADKVDQRRLIMVAQSLSAGLVFLLATITLLGMVQVWHILTIAFLAGAVEAFDQPARRAFFPQLIDRDVMMSAVAMNSSIWPGTRIMAPALAGFIISITNTAEYAFFVPGGGFLVMAIVVSTLRVPRVLGRASGGAVQDLMEGLNFITKNSVFSFLIALTFFNSFFAMAYVPLMPVFAKDILNVGPRGMGMLLGISGVGSLLTTIWFAGWGANTRKGILIIGGGLLGGLMVVAFGLTSLWFESYPLALGLLFFVGVFSTMQNTALQSALQVMVPDHIRGRVMGFYGMTYNIRP